MVRLLLEQDRPVRVIARDPSRLDRSIRADVEIIEGSHADPAVLDRALPGADALFWLVPPNPAAPSALVHYRAFGQAGAAAITHHQVGHVVGVSSAGHGWLKSAGTLSAAFAMDVELAAAGAAYRALSLPSYMENLVGQLGSIREHGSFSLTCAGDEPLATIATQDIAVAAVELLTNLSWQGQKNVPVFGPDRLTPDGMADVISEELDLPVAYRRITMDDFASLLRSGGAGEQAIKDMTEMFAAQDDGIYESDWKSAQIAATDFRTWCRQVLLPASRS